MKQIFQVVFCLWILLPLGGAELERNFRNPPNEARPQVWWHWVDGWVEPEAVTRDLESMKQAGIGGVTLFDVSMFKTSGPLRTLSPEWFAQIRKAIGEADRLGLEFSIHNCPGWSSGGGPWITPENAMKELRAAETTVWGGREIRMKLPSPAPGSRILKEVAVLAYPSIPGDGSDDADANVSITTDAVTTEKHLPPRTVRRTDLNSLPSGDPKQILPLEFSKAKKPIHFMLSYPKAFTAASAVLEFTSPPWNNGVELELAVSDDGKTYKRHAVSGKLLATGERFSFPPVKAKHFRLSILSTRSNQNLPLYRLALSAAVRIPDLAQKAFYRNGKIVSGNTLEVPDSAIIRRNSILDLSGNMDPDGNLVWRAPAGRWTILRFGCVARSSSNHPATREGCGLECDKMSRSGVDALWNGMMAKIVRDAGPLAGKTLKQTLIDSYEAGPQNWTELMPEHFRMLRGYDLRFHLPIMTGRYVESADDSERFLEDHRRTVSELFAEFYGKYYAGLVHRHGLRLVTEPYGGPFDNLLQGRYADIPTGEFWAGFKTTGNVRLAANIAQVNGKKLVQAESFSSSSNQAWLGTPADHKIQGDNVLASGVNRLVLHSFVHQPWSVDGAGLTLGHWGGQYNRKNTLWPFLRGWFDYLARAQYLLQQGNVPADILYLSGEDTPSTASFTPAPPYGYHAHACDVRTFLEKASVQNGQITLGNGIHYAILTAPETKVFSPDVLRKIEALVRDGGTVLFTERPERAFGLKNHFQSDREIATLAQALLPPSGQKTADGKQYGKGFVFFQTAPASILKKQNLPPDFTFRSESSGNRELSYIHRALPDRDIYFIANLSKDPSPFSFSAFFRTTGKTPEFWNAEDGSVRPVPVWRTENGNRTEIPMVLEHSESVFVVFRNHPPNIPRYTEGQWIPQKPGRTKDRNGAWTSACRIIRVNGKNRLCAESPGELLLTKPDGSRIRVRIPGKEIRRDLSTGWTVRFPSGRGAPEEIRMEQLEALGKHPDPNVRYYSGTILYRKQFILPEKESAQDSGTRRILDLGVVGDIARIRINGKEAGTCWHRPFRMDISRWLKSGGNTLEIAVANRWINRMIGDEQFPAEGVWEVNRHGALMRELPDWIRMNGKSPTGRTGFSSFRHWTRNDRLADSGLIGPVLLRERIPAEIPD